MPEKKQRGNPITEGYVTVAERIEKFYERYPDGRIITSIIEHDPERGFILIRADVYRKAEDIQPSATGHAYELKTEGYVNRTSYIENCETSAVGRALAMAGFEIRKGIASKEEMEKVARMNGTESDRLTSEQLEKIRTLRVNLHDIGVFPSGQEAKEHLLEFTNGRVDNASLLTPSEAKSYIDTLETELNREQ
jgi:hypothetical protein